MVKSFPPAQITTPETFILESLSLDDESNERYDGRILYQMLRLQGKHPKYYYFRTKKELTNLFSEFRSTGYRYLHLSCHGSHSCLELTFDTLSFHQFGELSAGLLNNRRLFISGCSLGTASFAEAVFAKSGGMYSIIAPTQPIRFEQAAVFWSSFYYLMHSVREDAMKKEYIAKALKHTSRIFEVSMAYFHKGKGNSIEESRYPASDTPILWGDADSEAASKLASREGSAHDPALPPSAR
jgi:hypothetical protein